MRRALIALGLVGCSATTTPPVPVDAGVDAGPRCVSSGAVDLLIEVDNTGGMVQYQRPFAEQLNTLLEALLAASRQPLSLHLGVITSDLGTPGSVVPSCANSDQGDDGYLNPLRNGLATRTHRDYPHWVGRPARCSFNPEQFPSFFTFDPSGDLTALYESFVCISQFRGWGCGIEQQLESMRRALVRAQSGVGPNAGFLRDDATLALLVVSDEEDGSVRDCRYAEDGDPDGDCRPPRGDATGVFDTQDMGWASNDPNLRFYRYTPFSPQDPTWSLNRYLDPAAPLRGFLGFKPGHPERVVFGAITGLPLAPPLRDDGSLDWTTLLGRAPDGRDGYVATSPEGPVSMRQANMDPVCSMRVVPGCRGEGTEQNGCSTTDQPFAWPARRLVEVARRFDVAHGNGLVESICRNDYRPFLRRLAARIVATQCASR